MDKLASKIFIDGGMPEETEKANKAFQAHFGYPLDGQTTNPSLIAKNLKQRMSGGMLTEEQALEEYKRIVQEITKILSHGSISIQVFANSETKASDMIAQAKERITWIPNASIKFPCTKEGLTAAEAVCQEMPINITLVFSQAQAAAVYEATKQAKHPVFISPFVGRLDDIGQAGMDVVANMLQLYKEGDRHVEVLTASVRSLDHLHYAIALGSPIITLPYKVFEMWQQAGFSQPGQDFVYNRGALAAIPFREDISLGKPWQEYDISHPLTEKGLAAFWSDWRGLFQKA